MENFDPMGIHTGVGHGMNILFLSTMAMENAPVDDFPNQKPPFIGFILY
jgi:hypothetical protein